MRMLSRICLLILMCMSFFSVFADEDIAEKPKCKGDIEDCITSDKFKISVGSITPGGTSLIDASNSTEATVDNILTEILNKLILVFGAFSILIMTIGAGYMIIYHGQDEFLSKGKSIFISGLIALAVALSAGLIVQLFTILLY